MGFSLKRSETADQAIRRLLVNRIDSAIEALSADDEAMHEGIHAARKRFKQIRAVLRLSRDALGGRYQEENRRFRDYGRRLASARDAQVMLQTLDMLTGLRPKLTGSAQSVRTVLAARRDEMETKERTDNRLRADIVADLQADRARIADWKLPVERFGILRPGLERDYRGGRRAMKRAYRSGTDTDFHEWRKRVKHHWYHLQLLAPMWPRVLEAHVAELKRLSDRLGDDHDLAVLRATLSAEPALYGGDDAIAPLLRLAERRQRVLRRQARRLGVRLYAEPTAEFGERLSVYYAAWVR